MSRVEKWERHTEVPLALLAIAFLVAYVLPILDTHLDHTWTGFFTAVSWTVWVAFGVDLIARLAIADQRGKYALHHWYDIVLVLVPMLRPLRLLRLIALMRILDRSAFGSLGQRVLIYATGATITAIGLGSVAVLDAERYAPGATITSFGDALWWACATTTTVGYGDFSPVTVTGRVVGVCLMFFGIGLVGTVTASMASIVVNRDRHPNAE